MERANYTNEQRAELLEKVKGFLKDGKSVDEAVQAAGITKTNFYAWRKRRLNSPASTGRPARLVTLEIPRANDYFIFIAGKSDAVERVVQGLSKIGVQS